MTTPLQREPSLLRIQLDLSWPLTQTANRFHCTCTNEKEGIYFSIYYNFSGLSLSDAVVSDLNILLVLSPYKPEASSHDCSVCLRLVFHFTKKYLTNYYRNENYWLSSENVVYCSIEKFLYGSLVITTSIYRRQCNVLKWKCFIGG